MGYKARIESAIGRADSMPFNVRYASYGMACSEMTEEEVTDLVNDSSSRIGPMARWKSLRSVADIPFGKNVRSILQIIKNRFPGSFDGNACFI